MKSSTKSASMYDPTAAFVDELLRQGVRDVCFAPGSRSTPLVLLFADHPKARLHRHIDERSAAFYALGIAKATRRAVALVCTSGTAAANFLPAVIEAYFSQTPLIVLTADRPPEARGVGSPQTIDQVKMYGDHVKWFAEMPLPHDGLIHHARAQARRAYLSAVEGPAGPVHINFPFREPLLPEARPFVADDDDAASTRAGTESEKPPAVLGQARPPLDAVRPLADVLAKAQRGLIVCGPQEDPALARAVTRLAARLGFPVLADPLSQVRCGPHSKELVIDAYDAFLRDPGFAAAHAPDLVLRFGAPPTSKALTLYLESHLKDGRSRLVLVDPFAWRDPSHRAWQVVRADAVSTCEALEEALAQAGSAALSEPLRQRWTETWQLANAAARQACTETALKMDAFFEGSVFVHLAELLPEGAALFAGNSMPVRDLDTFFPVLDRPVRMMANRGANGIDGVVSSALGASAATDDPLVLVIGDLSFLHDLGGLLAAKEHRGSATIVLVNNDGGGIFSFLPQTSRPDQFEALFGTPTGVAYHPVAEMFGVRFETARDWDHFRTLVKTGLARAGVDIIEIKTDRSANVDLHRRVWQAVSRAVEARLEQR